VCAGEHVRYDLYTRTAGYRIRLTPPW
jgi:hypothetical protein